MTRMEYDIIVLDEKYTECTICGTTTPLEYFIPMYEGTQVDITKTKEWAGMPVCRKCYNKNISDLKSPTSE